MLISNAHPSKFLKCADLQGRTVQVTIENVTMEEVGQGNDAQMKPILYMRGKDKGIALNVINSNVIADAYGDETDNWTGRQLEVYPDRTQFQGKMVDCIRMRAVADHAPPAAETQVPPTRVPEPPHPADDADIPF